MICLKTFGASAIFLLALSGCGKPPSGQPTHDGRDSTNCNFGTRFGTFCFLPFPAIMSNPMKYDQRRIQIMGYLAMDGDVLALYPDIDSYRLGNIVSSIALSGEPEEMVGTEKQFAFSHVMVRGVFDGSDTGRFRSRLGTMKRVIEVSPAPLRKIEAARSSRKPYEGPDRTKLYR